MSASSARVFFFNDWYVMLNVFTYWENHGGGGVNKWDYIEKCVDTIRLHCVRDCRFHHITSNNIDRYIPEGLLHPNWKHITNLGIKSDCVRAAVLFLYGGLYLDSDTVMLRSPAHLELDCDFAYTRWTKPPFRAIAAYVYSKRNGKVAEQWVKNINNRIASGNTGWCELGEGALTPALTAAPPTEVIELDRTTFMPLDVDAEVVKFTETGDIDNYITDKTVCVGLNHSWLTSQINKLKGKRQGVMLATREAMRGSDIMIHRLFSRMYDFVDNNPLQIGVCVPTFRRPELLGYLIHLFEQQTYQHRKMIILDDTGLLQSQSGDCWELISTPERAKTIGDKRNTIAAMCDTDVLVALDDDDIMLPTGLATIAAGMMRADWVRPGQVLSKHNSDLHRMWSWARADKQDKAFQGSWGVSKAAFNDVGGYASLSLGEDLNLALKLVDTHTCEVDPVEHGAQPYFVSAPYKNEHFSWCCKDYDKWAEQLPIPTTTVVVPTALPFSFNPVLQHVHKRSWQTDWYKDPCK